MKNYCIFSGCLFIVLLLLNYFVMETKMHILACLLLALIAGLIFIGVQGFQKRTK